METNIKAFKEGIRDGTPIALGYFAVSFTLGIAARNAGLTAFQGFWLPYLPMHLLGPMLAFS